MALRTTLSPANFPPPGRLIPVAGSRIHIHVSGTGAPCVVLEAGIAATSLSWALVEPEIAKRTSVVSYDRAGLGWSGPALTPRTPTVVARELREVLGHAGFQPPYILVGHSFGGLVVQRFAYDYPDLTGGLVLLDPLPPAEWFPLSQIRRRMLKRGIGLSRRGAVLARLGVVRTSLSFLLSGNRFLPRVAARMSSGSGGSGLMDRLAGEIRKLPRELWPAIAFHWSQAKNFEGMARHLECLPESCEQMVNLKLDPKLPVILLLAEQAPAVVAPSNWSVRRAPGSGHWVQLDRPDLVIGAVNEIFTRIRPPGSDG